MNLNEFYKGFLNSIDFSDDFSMRLYFEKIRTRFDACCIQYHNPKMLDEVRNYTLKEMHDFSDQVDQNEKDFDLYILECLNEASKMNKKELRREIVIGHIKLKIWAVIVREITKLGYSQFNIKYQNNYYGLLENLSDSFRKFQLNDLDNFISEFPMKNTKLHENEFQRYGDDDEKPFSSKESISWVNWERYEYEEIRIPRVNSLRYSASDTDKSVIYDINMNGSDQHERVSLLYAILCKTLKSKLGPKMTSGFFPHEIQLRQMTLIVDAETNQIDDEQVNILANQVKNIKIPGYQLSCDYSFNKRRSAQFVFKWKKCFDPKVN